MRRDGRLDGGKLPLLVGQGDEAMTTAGEGQNGARADCSVWVLVVVACAVVVGTFVHPSLSGGETKRTGVSWLDLDRVTRALCPLKVRRGKGDIGVCRHRGVLAGFLGLKTLPRLGAPRAVGRVCVALDPRSLL